MRKTALVIIVILLSVRMTFLEGKEKMTDVKLKDRPSVTAGAGYYQGNRPPLLPGPLIKLPVGQI